MKTQEAENLHTALVDQNIQLKNLSVDAYMKTIKLMKKLSEFLQERATDTQTLIKEYNKAYLELVKSEKFISLSKKKEELTTEETELLTTIPPVQVVMGNRLSGPPDFIDKMNAINERELKLKKDELNFIGDGKVFKALAENVSTTNQTVLYEFLFKQ